jgi:hypothetical protein
MEGNGRPSGGPVQRVQIGVVAEIADAGPSVEDVVEDVVEVVVEDVIEEIVDESPEASRAVTAAAELMVQATRLGFGFAELAGVTARAVVERFGATVATGVPPPAPVPRPPGVLPDALVGLVLSGERRLLDAAERVDARLAPVVSFVATRTPVRYPVDLVRSWVTGYAERGAADQAENRLAISALVGALIPEVVGAVLEEVDVDGVVASVDLDAIMRRVDLGAVVERLDIQAIVDRLDLDALAARIDMNAVVSRLDLPTITEQVMEEVDIGEIIRESTGTIGTGAVDTLRYSGMNMDRFVGRVVDRVLFRREGRSLVPQEANDEEPALVPAAPAEEDPTGP